MLHPRAGAPPTNHRVDSAPTMKAAFIFLDESSYDPMDLVALTGVLVPVDRYATVRDAMCQLAIDVSPTPADTVPKIIELHASNLLPDSCDEKRLVVLRRVVDIVSSSCLPVIRVAYHNGSEIAAFMPGDDKLYGITFAGIISSLHKVAPNTLVMPVMDGIPTSGRKTPVLIRAFAGNVRLLHQLRHVPSVASNLSVPFAGNIAEPVFADSAHSVMIQLVDIVSHLLLQVDRSAANPSAPTTNYRERVLPIAKSIPTSLLHTWSGRMQIGQPKGAKDDDTA